MTNRKGLFTPEQENFLIEVLTNVIKLKGTFFNMFKRLIIKTLVRGIDDMGFDKINPNWKEKLKPIIDSVLSGNYETSRQYITDLLNEKINFKNTSEETELRLFDSATRFIAAAIDMYIEKKRNI